MAEKPGGAAQRPGAPSGREQARLNSREGSDSDPHGRLCLFVGRGRVVKLPDAREAKCPGAITVGSGYSAPASGRAVATASASGLGVATASAVVVRQWGRLACRLAVRCSWSDGESGVLSCVATAKWGRLECRMAGCCGRWRGAPDGESGRAAWCYSHRSKHRTPKKKGGRFEISNCQSVAVRLCSSQPRRSTNAGIRLISQKSQHQMFSVAATRYVFPSQNPMTAHDTGNGFLPPVSKCKIVHSRTLVLCHGADLGYSVTDILRKVPY